MSKKIIDFNDKIAIKELYRDINKAQNIKKSLSEPIKEALSKIHSYEETHNLTVEQIKNIYRKLNITEQMTPQEMDESIICSNKIVILEKKFIKANIDKIHFVATVESILNHFNHIMDLEIINAVKSVIENFSYICLMSKNNFSFKDVCFKFFVKDTKTNEILVLVLNLRYDQKISNSKFLNIFKYKKVKIELNFFGTIVKTDTS